MEAFTALDSNEDGFVTWTEFVSFLEKGSGVVPVAVLSVKEAFQALDKNGNGKVNKKEFLSALGSTKHGAALDQLFGPKWMEAFFALDSDGSGKCHPSPLLPSPL